MGMDLTGLTELVNKQEERALLCAEQEATIIALREENKKLKDATIVVARETFNQKVREATEKFREMVNAMGEENKKLKEERDQARREAFWRMCEAYNGFHKNTDLRNPQWISEIKDAMEYHYDCCDADGSVEELHEGYIEWVGANETDPYGTNDDE